MWIVFMNRRICYDNHKCTAFNVLVLSWFQCRTTWFLINNVIVRLKECVNISVAPARSLIQFSLYILHCFRSHFTLISVLIQTIRLNVSSYACTQLLFVNLRIDEIVTNKYFKNPSTAAALFGLCQLNREGGGLAAFVSFPKTSSYRNHFIFEHF